MLQRVLSQTWDTAAYSLYTADLAPPPDRAGLDLSRYTIHMRRYADCTEVSRGMYASAVLIRQ